MSELRQQQRSLGADWREDLFDKQVEFLSGDAKRRAALCGRRAGKTEATAYWLIDACHDAPGETCVFIALSAGHCFRTLWSALERIKRRQPTLGIELRQPQGQLECRLPNGARIWLAGAGNRAEIEKFRGNRYRRVVIDEAGSFGSYLEDLVLDVLEPALGDLDGDLALTGTPPALPTGFFWEVTTGANGRRQWPVSHWTVLDNPRFPRWVDRQTGQPLADWHERADAYLADVRRENGWAEDHPRFVREYLGQWVQDEGALVFPYFEPRNGYDALPEKDGPWRGVTGLDLGFNDPCAWVYERYQLGRLDTWIDDCYQEAGLITSATAEKTKQWLIDHPGQLVVDTGGSKQTAEEMRIRYSLPVQAAEKTAKRVAIEILRGDVLSGLAHLHIKRCQPIIDEWSRLQWDEKHEGFDERCDDHLSDAALYAHRECRTRAKPEAPPPPEPGSEAAKRAEMDAVRARRLKQLQRDRRARGGGVILR